MHMYRLAVYSMILLFSLSGWAAAGKAESPKEAGGFVLGTPISDYHISSQGNYFEEIVTTGIDGFRKGYITYGTCLNPGKILRIKLKYSESDTEFFEKLLKRYKEKYGKTPKYVGDSFGNVKAWKWAFKNDEGKRVTLVLQHNLKDEDESVGNVLKLTLPDDLTAERKCFNQKYPLEDGSTSAKSQSENWEVLLPH